jgi:Fe-S-cluster containining protein
MSNVSLQVNAVELKTLFGRDVLNGDLREMGVKTVVEGKRYSVETKNPCVKFDVRTGRCLDYARRPSSCREFPFLVEQKALVIKSGCPISGKDPEYRKLAKITSSYGMVIVVRSGR